MNCAPGSGLIHVGIKLSLDAHFTLDRDRSGIYAACSLRYARNLGMRLTQLRSAQFRRAVTAGLVTLRCVTLPVAVTKRVKMRPRDAAIVLAPNSPYRRRRASLKLVLSVQTPPRLKRLVEPLEAARAGSRCGSRIERGCGSRRLTS
jgi:hypothetical protein